MDQHWPMLGYAVGGQRLPPLLPHITPRYFLCSLALLALVAAPGLKSANYTIKATGGNYTTIQACANAAGPGDTCTVYAGTYSEYVTPPKSGTPGRPITYQVNPGDTVSMQGFNLAGLSYITISGFEITGLSSSTTTAYPIYLSSSSYITVQKTYIHNGGSNNASCIFNASGLSSGSSYITIQNNMIAWCGQPPLYPGDAIYVRGNHWLIQSNTISHVPDFIPLSGSYNVVRGNTLGPVADTDFPGTSNQLHIDGIENSCGSGVLPLLFSLIEGNVELNNTSANGHFGIWHTGVGCVESNSIIRENAIINIGAYFILADIGGFTNIKVYNNSIAGVVNQTYSVSSFLAGATGACSINNIYYNATKNGGYVIGLDSTTTPTWIGSHDLAYNPACGATCTWRAPISTEASVILNRDPLFLDPSSDLHLRAGSPARGAGTSLTTVAASDAGSGIALLVNDASFFQDGAGIVDGDWIRVGTTTTVQITSIDYIANVLTLARAVNRSPGDPVYLYKNSNGQVILNGSSPDLGAYQYVAPAAPTNLNAVTH